jgi:hypothetical protein
MVRQVVFDVEADGLTPTKIHCLSANINRSVITTSGYGTMRKFLSRDQVLIGHNITRWDIPNLERLLKIKVECKLVDTLALSWYLEPNRIRHGLESYGEDFGVPKPVVNDWEGLSQEEYNHRCEQDVEINTKLWDMQWKKLVRLYGSDEEAWRCIDYLQFKMHCAALQEACGWRVDKVRCEAGIEELTKEKEHKLHMLTKAMPLDKIWKVKQPPKKPFKQDGTLSASGKSWLDLFYPGKSTIDFSKEVEKRFLHSHKEPKPTSSKQVKDWLFGLGWKPRNFKYVREDSGNYRKIPQVKNADGDGVCDSIKELYGKEPNLEYLDGLSVLSHRIPILQGFLDNCDEGGKIQAQIQGITNTLRLKHKVAVNLPGVGKPYGELVRGCLIADEGYELCGSDMSGLEDRTGNHYAYEHDAVYVAEKSAPGYDPHTNMGVVAGMMTKDEEEFYKWYDSNH